ncbi:hypothetical protein L7F22_035549 [Adiantum nelumboides]|nr:hypothetical protein [Adiantum nelumboides]
MLREHMDTSRGKKMTTRGSTAAARSVAIVGKENICPNIRRDAANASRSPLPEGFPRAPLQDITHILSPINVALNDGDSSDLGVCKPLRKRSKCLEAPCSTATCESKPQSSHQTWKGLRKCEPVETSVGLLHAEAGSKQTEGDEFPQVAERSASNAEMACITMTRIAIDSRRHPAVIDSEEVVEQDRRADSKEESKLNSEVKNLPSVGGLSKAVAPRRQQRNDSTSFTCPSSRSAQQKPKMSHLMKLR